jgi:hypothetical protein
VHQRHQVPQEIRGAEWRDLQFFLGYSQIYKAVARINHSLANCQHGIAQTVISPIAEGEISDHCKKDKQRQKNQPD